MFGIFTEVKEAEERLHQKAAISCAQQVAARYEGTSCMKTSIHAQAVDPEDIYGQFWYDEPDMLKWHRATKRQKEAAAGSRYYKFLEDKFEEHYIRYDNGVEGIRVEGDFRCPAGISRVPPPVPDLSTAQDGVWHYHTPETLPESYLDVQSREVDDFCPRAQLNKLVKNCGVVHLIQEERGDTTAFYDGNETWAKIESRLDQFVGNICGKDLGQAARKHAEDMYLREVKRAILTKKSNSAASLTNRQLEAIKTGPLTLRIQRRKP